MARPKKQTVDYFPHYCNASKTLKIVEAQYGNDGYAFWFKMLEIIGRTEGHVFDYSTKGAWLYLLTEIDIPEAKAKEILQTFATLGMIDKELWEKNIYWVQHFVDEHVALYARRKVDLPQRPGGSVPMSAFSLTQVTGNDAVKDDLKVAGMIKYFEDTARRMLTPKDLENLKDFADNYPDGWFEKAVDEAVKNSARAPIRYIEKILESWKTEGVNPLVGKKARAHKQGPTSAEKREESITKPLR